MIGKRNIDQLKTIMTNDLGFSNRDIAKLNFKDEITILNKMKKKHSRIVNSEAATKIQKVGRGFITRKRLIPILNARRNAAIYIQIFIRRY